MPYSVQGKLPMPQCPQLTGVGIKNLNSCTGTPYPALATNQMFAATLTELPTGYCWG